MHFYYDEFNFHYVVILTYYSNLKKIHSLFTQIIFEHYFQLNF